MFQDFDPTSVGLPPGFHLTGTTGLVSSVLHLIFRRRLHQAEGLRV
jgi:hypothetical protein